jgi:4a-hydroxytetrahydrobiopterin dehydratase
MNELLNTKCEVCQVGAPKVNATQLTHYLKSLMYWELIEEEGIQKICRDYSTKSYPKTMNFVNSIADISTKEGHHPAIFFEYDHVTVIWWTHKIEGLHINDFIMAAKSDVCYLELA